MTLTAQGCSQGKSIFKGHSDSGACTALIITARPPRQWIITSFHLRAWSTSPHTGRQPLNGTELSPESEKLSLPGTYSLCPRAGGSCGCGLPAGWKEGLGPGGNPSPLRYPLPCPKRPEPGVGGEAGGRAGGRGGMQAVGRAPGGKKGGCTACRAAGCLQLCPPCKGPSAGGSGCNPGEKALPPRKHQGAIAGGAQPESRAWERDRRDRRQLFPLWASCPQLSRAGVNEMTSDHAGAVLIHASSLPGVPAAL